LCGGLGLRGRESDVADSGQVHSEESVCEVDGFGVVFVHRVVLIYY
jgi:hypothetical protein